MPFKMTQSVHSIARRTRSVPSTGHDSHRELITLRKNEKRHHLSIITPPSNEEP